jgi:hypothetical protein
MGWLVAVAVAFFMVHILAGTTWLHASANEAPTSQPEAISPLCD